MYSILCVKVAVIDPEAPSASAVMEEARKFMIATFYKEAVVPLALDLTADNDEMRRVYLNKYFKWSTAPSVFFTIYL